MFEEEIFMPTTKEDWLKTGLSLLVSHGVAGLTIDGMCQILDVTKGSFYHHFKNLQDFKDQLLTYWQEVDTQQVVEAASTLNRGSFGVDSLIQILAGRSAETANPELAIRAWTRQDETVQTFVEQVDTMRIQMVQQMLTEIVGEDRSILLARMLYTFLVGCYSILPPVEKEEILTIYDEFKRLYT
jgi:AcrR family transcriptional regulator